MDDSLPLAGLVKVLHQVRDVIIVVVLVVVVLVLLLLVVLVLVAVLVGPCGGGVPGGDVGRQLLQVGQGLGAQLVQDAREELSDLEKKLKLMLVRNSRSNNTKEIAMSKT